jgi:cytochrome c556
VWSDRPAFTRRGGALLAAARALQDASRSGDIARIRTAFPAVGQACRACHDDFREPE